MSTPAIQEEQLLELLLHLKKTTPEQARVILNSQPQIAYALLAVMVNLNAVNMEVVQKTLTSYGALPGSSPIAPPPVTAPVSAIPPHLAQPPNRGGTPTYPSHAPERGGTPTYPPQVSSFSAPPVSNQYSTGSSTQLAGPPSQPTFPARAPPIPEALAAIPDAHRALIMRVIAMTPDEIHRMPPQDRANIIQLRQTLGLPT